MPVLTSPTAPTHELPGTSFTSLATPSVGSVDTSVWRVEIEPGTPATPHELTKQEVFVVLSGRARVRIGADECVAAEGDVIVVPAATPFELSNAGDAMFRAICCMPTDGQALLGGEPFTPPWAL